MRLQRLVERGLREHEATVAVAAAAARRGRRRGRRRCRRRRRRARGRRSVAEARFDVLKHVLHGKKCVGGGGCEYVEVESKPKTNEGEHMPSCHTSQQRDDASSKTTENMWAPHDRLPWSQSRSSWSCQVDQIKTQTKAIYISSIIEKPKTRLPQRTPIFEIMMVRPRVSSRP